MIISSEDDEGGSGSGSPWNFSNLARSLEVEVEERREIPLEKDMEEGESVVVEWNWMLQQVKLRQLIFSLRFSYSQRRKKGRG